MSSDEEVVVFQNPLDPTTWKLSEAATVGGIKRSKLRRGGTAYQIIPVFMVDPSQNPIKSTGAFQLKDVTSGNYATIFGSPYNNDEQNFNSLNGLLTVGSNWLYNAKTGLFDRSYANSDQLYFTTDSTTATFTGADTQNVNGRGFMAVFDNTVFTGGTNYTNEIDYKDPQSGKYVPIWTDAAQVGTATRSVILYPGLGAAPGGFSAAVNGVFSRTFRCKITKTGSFTAFTSTVGVTSLV